MNWRDTTLRHALIFLAISVSVSVTACSGKSTTPPQAQYPHSPGDVVASGDRQVTREWRPRVDTELVRRQPELHSHHWVPLVGLMPVWLTPHRRDNGDLIGGQWLWIPSRPGMGAGPLQAPTAPTLESVAAKPSEAAPPGSHVETERSTDRSRPATISRRASVPRQPATPPTSKVPKQMQAQYQALRRSLGLPTQEEGGP
jgi:hypothetical protein